jgi:hypothetical protein
MNILLYLTLLLLIILFIYSLFIKENFSNIVRFYDFNTMPIDSYNQNYEFVSKNNYNYMEDSKFINQYDNFLKLGKVEYQNLRSKLEIKNKQKQNDDFNKINKQNIKFINKLDRMTNYPVIKRELSLIEFDHILSTLKHTSNFKYNKDISHLIEIEFNQSLIYSYHLVKEWILEQISIKSDEKLYEMKYVNNEKYKYIEDQILTYKADYKSHLEQFIFKMRVYRDNKMSHYIVYFDILFDNKNINYYINDIIILGTDIEENIVFSEFKKNYFELSDTFNSDINLDKDAINKFIELKQKKQIHENDNNYCFFKNASDKNNCISVSRNNNSLGIYDSPCLYNEDCPYYKKNKNYPNSRGGCIKGYCEMPTNVKLVGYKEFIDGNSPICYNCKKTNGCKGMECNMCCDKQKDTKLYPNLDGPDYAYYNDYNQRMKYMKEFENKNMAPISLIA